MKGLSPPNICKVVCLNERKIASLRQAVPDRALLAGLADRHRAAAHPRRLAILFVLARDECCVCDLAHILGLPVSTVSQHLRTLRQAGLVRSRQEGKLVFHSLADPALMEWLTVPAPATAAPPVPGPSRGPTAATRHPNLESSP